MQGKPHRYTGSEGGDFTLITTRHSVEGGRRGAADWKLAHNVPIKARDGITLYNIYCTAVSVGLNN